MGRIAASDKKGKTQNTFGSFPFPADDSWGIIGFPQNSFAMQKLLCVFDDTPDLPATKICVYIEIVNQCLVGARIGRLLGMLFGVGHEILRKDEALGGESNGRDDGGLAVNYQGVAMELVGLGLVDGKDVLPAGLADL